MSLVVSTPVVLDTITDACNKILDLAADFLCPTVGRACFIVPAAYRKIREIESLDLALVDDFCLPEFRDLVDGEPETITLSGYASCSAHHLCILQLWPAIRSAVEQAEFDCAWNLADEELLLARIRLGIWGATTVNHINRLREYLSSERAGAALISDSRFLPNELIPPLEQLQSLAAAFHARRLKHGEFDFLVKLEGGRARLIRGWYYYSAPFQYLIQNAGLIFRKVHGQEAFPQASRQTCPVRRWLAAIIEHSPGWVIPGPDDDHGSIEAGAKISLDVIAELQRNLDVRNSGEGNSIDATVAELEQVADQREFREEKEERNRALQLYISTKASGPGGIEEVSNPEKLSDRKIASELGMHHTTLKKLPYYQTLEELRRHNHPEKIAKRDARAKAVSVPTKPLVDQAVSDDRSRAHVVC